ncbi:MAG TPA: FAD-linked oxidase C-terminal domain-containing protein, partial [Acidimicrobiales bacterium]|nr:FAD-linked oxidase C-terminal domain-containing protein [Acidimicrobiales bacterium]
IAASAHLSHSYTDGACLYFTFAGRSADPERYYREAYDAVTGATLDRGGALSHHHGVGLNRGGYMRSYLGPAFDVLAALKSALDPHGILNPGKLGLPSPFGDPPAVPGPRDLPAVPGPRDLPAVPGPRDLPAVSGPRDLPAVPSAGDGGGTATAGGV